MSGFFSTGSTQKPLHHFFPGTAVLSFGTEGCNLSCSFCQNWDISKSREIAKLADEASPETIARAARELGCHSVAFTYNDPTIFFEYASDVADACREKGIRAVAVTAGYMSPAPRRDFYAHIDAANVDLKAFTEDFYHRVTSAHLAPVLETLEYLRHETKVWLEITNLLIPGLNDSDHELDGMTRWIAEKLGRDVPVHFTAFHPDWKMTSVPPTPSSTLARARRIARENGIRYAYTGNILDPEGESTRCASCGELLIGRVGYDITAWGLSEDGRCRGCGAVLPGRFEARPGTWGAQRRPVHLARYAA